MPKYLIEYGAGRRIVQEGRTLLEAKMRLCRQLKIDWKNPYEGARTMRLIEVLDKEESESVCV